MTPKLRTILYHSSLPGGQKTVKNPAGWKKLVISLERSETYNTLIEQFKSSNLWYGNARETLLAIQASDGANAEVRVTCEVKWIELGAYEFIFDGLIKLAQFEEIFTGIKSNKLNAPIIRDGFWSKFHNRYDRPVNLEGTTDLDGGTRAAVNKTSVLMRSQVIRQYWKASGDKQDIISKPYSLGSNEYGIIDLPNDDISEIEHKYTYTPEQSGSLRPFELFAIKYSGEYNLDVFICTSVEVSTVQVLIQVNEETPIVATATGFINHVEHVYQDSLNLKNGDFLRIYFFSPFGSNFTWLIKSSILNPKSFIEITADTTFPDSETDAYLIKEAAQSIISKYVGADSPLISTKFSNTTFNRNAIFRGKHNRGYYFSEKEISMSFKNWWEAANPAFNLCLGYTKVLGVDKIYIEDKSYAYNPTSIVNLPNARNLVRRYDLERFFSSIEFGCEKWSAESAFGIDDHQTKRIYNTNIKTFGQDFKNLSKFFCAALGIEQSRRNRVELGKDDKLDEELMMVSVSV